LRGSVMATPICSKAAKTTAAKSCRDF